MSTIISQRELRNDNAQIMRRVEAGESFIVTRNGRPVAQVAPLEQLPVGTRRMTGREINEAWARTGLGYDPQAWMRDVRAVRDAVDDDPFEDPWERVARP